MMNAFKNLLNVFLVLLVVFYRSVEGSISFLGLGDWGGHALDHEQYGKNVDAVADAMKAIVDSESHNVEFLVNTGDNFYWCGIKNTSDFQIKDDYVTPYKGAVADLTWYNVLGNHEYGYNVEAQIELSKIFDSWIMPSRYYTKRVQLGSSNTYVSFIFLDTSPCVNEYREDNSNGWDPCSTKYPTCSIKYPSQPDDHFEGECHFHTNILSQECGRQFTWFKKTLTAVPKEDWLIIVGHHPFDEVDVEDFIEAAEDRGFDLYINGHSHNLAQYEIDGNNAFVTTGAGSMVNVYSDKHEPEELSESEMDQLMQKAKREKSPAKYRTFRKENGLNISAKDNGHLGHTYKSLYYKKVAGFTLHTFSSTFKSLTTDYYSHDGTILHSFKVEKSGHAPAPGPGPPNPGRVCCHYSDAAGACSKGDICCKTSCDNPLMCSYDEIGCAGHYGQKHDCKFVDKECVVTPEQ